VWQKEVTKSINAQAALYGKNAPKMGKTPAIALVNPKCGHNVGAAVRAASCFGAKQVWFTGNRVTIDSSKRLPREERMKGYRDVELRQFDNFFEQFKDVTPIAIELRPNAESLATFQHPANALYVFGPEDGSLVFAGAAMANDAMDNITESFTKDDDGTSKAAKITIDIDTDPKDPGSILPKPKPDAQITITTKPDKSKKTSRISKKRSKRW